MEASTIISLVGLGLIIIGNVYMASRFVTMLELKPSKEKVTEMIEEKFTNHCPFQEKIDNLSGGHLEKMIDDRIDLHPTLKQYKVTAYRIDQLEPDVKQIKTDIQNILLALAKGQGNE